MPDKKKQPAKRRTPLKEGNKKGGQEKPSEAPKKEIKPPAQTILVKDRDLAQIEHLNSTIKKQKNQIDNLLQKNRELEGIIAKMTENIHPVVRDNRNSHLKGK